MGNANVAFLLLVLLSPGTFREANQAQMRHVEALLEAHESAKSQFVFRLTEPDPARAMGIHFRVECLPGKETNSPGKPGYRIASRDLGHLITWYHIE